MGKVIPGYIGKSKGALQVAAERGYLDIEGKLLDGENLSLHQTLKNSITGVVSVNRTTSILGILKNCDYFKNEQT